MEPDGESVPAVVTGGTGEGCYQNVQEREMITLKGAVTDPCVICGSREGTAKVKFADGTLDGVLCMKHVYERLKPYVKAVRRKGGRFAIPNRYSFPTASRSKGAASTACLVS